jgi:hypothetical protein
MTSSFIALDSAGWGNHPRLTHVESGATLLRQPWMDDTNWHAALVAWAVPFFPDTPIHRCPDAYVANESNFAGTLGEIIDLAAGAPSA